MGLTSMLVLVLLSLSSLVSLAIAQTCGGAGFDISALSGRTLGIVFGNYPWVVNPCGQASGIPGITCGAQVCQGNVKVSTYSPANVQWIAADNGLVQLSQNGDLCGGDGPRQSTLRFVCNPSATTAYISDAQEIPQCHYLLVVQTNLVCTPPTGVTAIGSTFVSNLCGGGVYPLAQSLSEDISFTPDGGVTQVYINVCNRVQNIACAQAPGATSVCQAYYPLNNATFSSNNVFQLADFDPTRSTVQYTRTPNGLTMFTMDGAYTNGYPRAMNITFICRQGATVADPSSWQVVTAANGGLIYSVNVYTSAVCGTAFAPLTCGGAGVNLNSIAGLQLSYQNAYFVSPCANVLTSSTGGCSSQVCQGGTPLGYYDPAVATWTLTDTGVMQQIQDGQSGCGGLPASMPRQTTLRFVCNATATTPFILAEYEGNECRYVIDVSTSAACGYPVPRTVGTTWASDLCGGGAYNLNLLSPGYDIVYNDTTAGQLFINPCGPVLASACTSSGASVCYTAFPVNSTNTFNLALWQPYASPVRYTLLSNGIQQIHIDGSYCGASPRQTTINYVCDATATTPVVTSYSGANCVYTMQVNTNKVCGAAYSSVFAGCGGAGYDLSQSVAGVQMTFHQQDDGQNNQFTVNVCSRVGGLATQGCNVQACQPGYNLSTYDSTAVWIPADNGVIQMTQNGAQCGGAYRETVIRFVCNVLAFTPSIIEGGEEPGCHYFIIIQTNAVCVKPASLYAVGNSFVSDLCGGGAYNLDVISGSDISYFTGSSYLAFNPCGQVKNTSCAGIGNPSYIQLCEAYTLAGNNFTRIAIYDPVRSPVSYTLTANGLTQYSQAGDSLGNYPRALSVSYVCNAAATTPYITSYTTTSVPQPTAPTTSFQQVYTLVVQTSAVCGAAFQKQACGANGFDLSSLVGVTITGTFSNYLYAVAPCGSVHASATQGCTGQVCQSGYPLSYYSPSSNVWTTSDTGLVQFSQDGVYCGNAFPRSTTIRFVCNTGATTPSLTSATEGPICHYTIVVQTSLVCNPSTGIAYPVARTVGTTWVSDFCGGNAYLLSGVSPNADIVYQVADGSTLYVNPCGGVRNATCAAISAYSEHLSACQVSATGAVTQLAAWFPAESPIYYTLLANGIQQTHMDSNQFCNGNIRTTNIQYICSASASTAVVQSLSTATTATSCTTTIVIATSTACAAPYVPTCKYGAYDLTPIGSQTFFTYVDNFYWAVSPCGNVTGNVFYPGCTGEVCQDGGTIATYDPASVVWTLADNGLVQQIQNGDSCGGDGLREGSVRFICNTTALTPFVAASAEEPTCHYILNVQTAAVCPISSPWRANGGTQNIPWVSDQCGGGAYDLTALGFSDIVYPEGNQNLVFLNPCGYVLNGTCGGLGFSSVCEYYSGTAYQIAIYDPSRSITTYTLINGGLTQAYSDGAYNNGYPRGINITYLCNAAATTPVILSYSNAQVAFQGGSITQYQMVVSTSVVCGTPFTNLPTCGTSTYQLTPLIGNVLPYTDSGSNRWWVNPCGQVDVPDANGCTGQVCQVGTIISYYTPASTTWTPADNGVLAVTQDGQVCGAYGPRTAYIRYVCSAAATVPVVAAISEEITCRYTIIIQTSLVCGITPSHAVGSSFVSDSCGGGAYDLRQVAPMNDIVASVDGGNFVFINPCGAVRNTSCNLALSSVCYGYTPLTVPASNDYNLARFDPLNAPVKYTVLTNGVMQTHVDGDYCGSPPVPRTVQISYICNAAMTTPQVTSYTSANCQYNITVQTSAVCGAPFSVPVATGSLCYITYALPGNVDYPWSVALAMSVTYNPTLSYTASGTAYQLLAGTGTRTYTNRFGQMISQRVTLSTSANLLYVGGPNGPLDTNGLQYSTPTAIQLPGYTTTPVPLVTLFNASGGSTGQPGTLVEGLSTGGSSSRADKAGQAFLSNIPGFQNFTIGASDINALAPQYGTCSAPITFTNGLRTPTQPSNFNGAVNSTFVYTITDGITYSVTARLRLQATSAFATTTDQLGNPYQTIVGISGTRTYTYLINGQSMNSTITGLTSVTQKKVDQRFYPYSLLASSPGVYTPATAPYLDYDGIGFTISPPAPNNGFPVGSASSGSVVSVFVNGFTSASTTAALTEYITDYGTAPNPLLQQQSYTLIPAV